MESSDEPEDLEETFTKLRGLYKYSITKQMARCSLLKVQLQVIKRQNSLSRDDLCGLPRPGVVDHGVGDDLCPSRQLVTVLTAGEDLDGGERCSLLLQLTHPLQVRGQGGEGGGLPRPHRHGGEAGGGRVGGVGLLMPDLGDTDSTGHGEEFATQTPRD